MSPARVTIIGAGLMGHGIAQVFALGGHPVVVQDPDPAALAALDGRIRANLRDLGEDEAAAKLVRGCADLAEAVAQADYVVEAAPENLGLKQRIFAQVEAHAPPDAVFASNTSVIPITDIMGGLRDRSRAIGTHWWNPPFLVPLVEVIQTEWTDASVIEWALRLHRNLGKQAVHVRKDVPGFIGNRLQHALWREAVSIVARGIADAETVDTVVKAAFGRRLAVLGPLENADMVGTDLTLAIHQTVLPDIENRPGPDPLLESLVAAGKLGFKTGSGFRDWPAEAQSALRARMVAHLKAGRLQDIARNAAESSADSGAVAAWTRQRG